jgi:hypothetical protein
MPFIRSEVLTLMKRLKYRIIVGVTILLLIPAGVFAMGVSPYLPLNMSPEIERQIERLLILAGRPVMTRPIAVATVLEALSDARKADEALCNQVERYLERYIPNAGLTQLRAEIALDSGESKQVLPNQYGEKVDSSWKVSGETFLRLGDYISFNLGGIAYQDSTNPTGSMLSLGIDYAQLDIGYRPHWLSPFTDSSMLISTEAPTMPSVTLSNYRPISPLGLTYEVYLAQMSESSHIKYYGGFTTGHPRLAGVHFQIQPSTGYALAINRQFQFGGGARKNDTFSDFIRVFFHGFKNDITGQIPFNEQFGNEQASITSRIVFPGKRPFATYFEYAAEDFSRMNAYHLGSSSFSAGIDIPHLWEEFDLIYEMSNWQDAWYVHSLYRDGLTNHKLVVGNWFGDQRRFNDDAGGVSNMLRLGYQVGENDYLEAVYRTLRNNAYTKIDYKHMKELGLSYSFPWSGHAVGVGFYAGNDTHGDHYMRMNASLDLDQDWSSTSSESSSFTVEPAGQTDLLIDMGVNYGNFESDERNLDGEYRYPDMANMNLHLGIGALYRVSEHGDLGAHIDWDHVRGYNLYSIRMLDYRYRIGSHFAVNGFFGVSFLNLKPPPPALGYYLGVGSQFVNIIPKTDLCISVQKNMQMSRTKLKAYETPYYRTFHNFQGIAFYLSRHFKL